MSESNEILSMRALAWERAKGELQAYLHTFWPEYHSKTGQPLDRGFNEAYNRINSFIKEFEDNCR